jgi:hypothetical protein
MTKHTDVIWKQNKTKQETERRRWNDQTVELEVVDRLLIEELWFDWRDNVWVEWIHQEFVHTVLVLERESTLWFRLERLQPERKKSNTTTVWEKQHHKKEKNEFVIGWNDEPLSLLQVVEG